MSDTKDNELELTDEEKKNKKQRKNESIIRKMINKAIEERKTPMRRPAEQQVNKLNKNDIPFFQDEYKRREDLENKKEMEQLLKDYPEIRLYSGAARRRGNERRIGNKDWRNIKEGIYEPYPVDTRGWFVDGKTFINRLKGIYDLARKATPKQKAEASKFAKLIKKASDIGVYGFERDVSDPEYAYWEYLFDTEKNIDNEEEANRRIARATHNINRMIDDYEYNYPTDEEKFEFEKERF